MRPTVFQRAELRDENNNIIQQGTYGKNSPLSNSTNDAWIDYVMNNLEALRSMSVGATIPVETLPESGETGKAYVVTTGTDAGKLFMWDGEDWVEITGSIGDYLPITGGTITGNLSVTGNATLSGTSTAVTPNADDNSTKVATTEYVQTEIKPIETDVDIADKRITNIEKLLQGNLYDYQTDYTSGYTKSVPAGAMPYAGLERVGGKTVVWNQLQANTTSRTTNGVVFTFDSANGTLAVSEETQGATRANTAYWLDSNAVKWNWIAGHKYLIRVNGSIPNVLVSTNWYISYPKDTLSGQNIFYTNTVDRNANLQLQVKTGDDISTPVTFKPQVFDLTLMFGAGNEPSTVEEFEAMFPASYYAYNEGALLSAGVTEVDSYGYNHLNETYMQSHYTYTDGVYYGNVNMFYDNYNNTIDQTYKPNTSYYVTCDLMPANSAMDVRWLIQYTDGTSAESNRSNVVMQYTTISITTDPTKTISSILFALFNGGNIYAKNIIIREANPLQTYPIPTAIRNLEGYGWSAGSVYNYVDFERKVFVQNVGKVILDGSQASAVANIDASVCRRAYTVSNVKLTGSLGGVPDNCIVSDYLAQGYNGLSQSGVPCVHRRENNSSQIFVSLGSIGIAAGVDDATKFNTYMSLHPLTVYYALETPTETDISAYLTDDNLISVESGGTLTFENQHGDDYLLPVPSEETYMIDLQSALGE